MNEQEREERVSRYSRVCPCCRAAVRSYAKHVIALEELARFGGNDDPNLDGRKLYRTLRWHEGRARRLAEDYCAGYFDSDEWEIRAAKRVKAVLKVLGWKRKDNLAPIPIHVNGDPRGYALKLDETWEARREEEVENNYPRIVVGLVRDWGGYGILAPDFKEG